MNTVLVTGGAGFIGSHTVKKLLDLGNRVVCVDNFNDYYSPDVKRHNASEFLGNLGSKLYVADICDYLKLREIFEKEKPDKVCHLAARAGVRSSIYDPLLYQDVNVKGTTNILDLCVKCGVKKLVFASSSSVYGHTKKIPFREKDCTDKPISPYAATKKSSELMAHAYHHLHGLKCIGLRFFTVYGPSGRPDMAPFLFTHAISSGKSIKQFGNGSSQRDYTYIDDVVDGIASALDADLDFEIINIGNNKPVKLKNFIKLIEELVGKKAEIIQEPMPQGDVPITYADITKAKELLNYSPETTIEEGMEKFVSWYKDHHQLYL
ncbi:NAD-dependent epimerase/dehydratase family protein [Patescibacteria group bacterium]